MGLKDLDGVGEETSNSRGSNETSPQKKQQEKKTIGEGTRKREYSQMEWVKVRRVIRNEFGMLVRDVLELPAEERDDILDEAEDISAEVKKPDETESYSSNRCIVCGQAADDSSVEIEGKTIHTHHTAGQIENSLSEQ